MTRPETDRLNAALSGRYRIERELGEGGMATVYLAEDVRHRRHVALKVLRPELAVVVGADRFLQEIETTANLTHPHILPLHDSGEADGFLFYVMPYVEGETLRDRLDRDRQLPVDDAVRIARDLARALDYAHRQGVIHRDIKPANVLLHDGQPLISDFGIALAVGAAGQGRMTETGMSLGTPHYMSPEQATGDRAVGPPTDVYSLGCVLYEMLTGEPPYTGSTAQAVLGRIVTGSPDPVTERRRSVPPHVDAAIRKALEKIPADRFGSAGEMARALGDPGFRWGGASEGAAVGAAAGGGLESGGSFWAGGAVGAGLVVAVAGLLAVGGAITFGPGSDEGASGTRYGSLLLPPESGPAANTSVPLAISRNGSRIVYRIEESDGTLSIWTRRFTEREPVQLTELGGAGSVFLSPDGLWVGFNDVDAGVLRRMPATGGSPEELGPTGLDPGEGGFLGADWGLDGTIVFATDRGLRRLSTEGGPPEELTRTDPDGRIRHSAPSLLPDGSGVVFAEADRVPVPPESRIRVLFFDGREADLVAGHTPRVTDDGILIYSTDLGGSGALRAVRLVDGFAEATGAPLQAAADVWITTTDRVSRARYAVADDGTLVTFPFLPGSRTRALVWADREGNRQPLLDVANSQLPPGSTGLGPGRISPDGNRIAIRANYPSDPTFRLFVFDIERGVVSPVTVDWSADWPVWTPDGERLAFNRFSGSEQNLYWARADNADTPASLFGDNPFQRHAQEFTADGRYVLLQERSEPNGPDSDIRLFAVEGGEEPRSLVDGPGLEIQATLAPGEGWMAYVSDESGQREVYVTDFPDARSRIKVSTEPAHSPMWSPTRDELYYQRLEDGAVMVVPVRFEPTFRPEIPRVLFEWDYRVTWPFGRIMDVHPDGERFLLIWVEGAAGGVPRIDVVHGWLDEVRRRLDEAGR